MVSLDTWGPGSGSARIPSVVSNASEHDCSVGGGVFVIPNFLPSPLCEN